MIVFQFISYTLKTVLRHVFWLYKLSQSSIGKQSQIVFPVIREGAGTLTIGDKVRLEKHTNLGIGQKGTLSIGQAAVFETQSTILVNKNCQVTIGENFKLGAHARLYVNNHWEFGNDVKIETHCAIFSREPQGQGILKIGNGTHIGDFTIIDLVQDVTLGNEVAIGPNCTLYTHDHEYTNKELPAWKGGLVSKPIFIEDGAWIGSNVTILPGVTIGKRAVIAAGSVVTKNVPSETIYGGIPAKLIKEI
ncbi:acyltransferase [Formosa sp. A9]|uniref:acyltransferase n=1 Tax=Formosa sp. A9 TaxID=3442641 RepID=UPI003EBF012A